MDLTGTETELSLAIVSYYLDILDGRIEKRLIEGNLAVISLFNYLKDFCIVSSKIMLLTSLFSPYITSIVDILRCEKSQSLIKRLLPSSAKPKLQLCWLAEIAL